MCKMTRIIKFLIGLSTAVFLLGRPVSSTLDNLKNAYNYQQYSEVFRLTLYSLNWLAYLSIFFVWFFMLWHCAKKQFDDRKTFWIIAMIVFWYFGAIAYFFVVYNKDNADCPVEK